MGDLMDEVINHGTEIKSPASNWVDNAIPPKYDLEKIKSAIEKKEIDPPLLFFPTFNGKELRKLGLLNRGNILDGDRRIMNVVRFLKDQTPEYIDNFKLTAFVGRVDLAKYAAFNLYYFAEPWGRRSRNFVKKFLGKEVDHLDDEYSLKFFEQWYLVLERVGFIRKGNKARIN
jgi:hypothetical protein